MEKVVAKIYEYRGRKYIKILSNRSIQIRPVGQKYLEGYKNGISMPQWLFEAIKKIEPKEEIKKTKEKRKEEKIELLKAIISLIKKAIICYAIIRYLKDLIWLNT